MRAEQELINSCLKKETRAQEELYKTYSARVYGVCLRYASSTAEADDILQEGFIKIFQNLDKYRGDGSFEGWIRRTIINTAINFYRREMNRKFVDPELALQRHAVEPDAIHNLAGEELVSLLQYLPAINRHVFNMFVIEGYSHKEISDMLGIPENTSKSYLLRSREILRNKINSTAKEK